MKKKTNTKRRKHEKIIRGPIEVALDITNKCNLNCLHCFNRSNENDRIENELTDREIIKFSKDLTALKPMNMCICGGEPLLRFDLITNMTPILREAGTQVSMVTNGLLLTEEKAKKLFDVGIMRVQVSIDGANETSHDRLRAKKGSYKKAIEAIRIFKNVGFTNVGIAFTPTSFNVREVKEAYKVLKKLEITDFRVQPLMLLGRTKVNMEEIKPSPMQYREMVRDLNELKYGSYDVTVNWGDPVDHLIRHKTVSKDLARFLAIQANGDIVVSPYLPVSVGNIKKHSIREYWDKGWPEIWKLEFIREVAGHIKSVPDFNNEHEGMPNVWFEKNFMIDLIDNDLFKNYQNMKFQDVINSIQGLQKGA